MPKITFKSNDFEITVDAVVGDTLLETAHKNNIELFGGCGGAGVCGTCHVLIDDGHLEKLNEKSDDEDDLLDVLQNGCGNSRLACQVVVSEDLDGMVVTIP